MRRKTDLSSLHSAYINQPNPPSEVTMRYVVALRAKIDDLEIRLALAERMVNPPEGTQG